MKNKAFLIGVAICAFFVTGCNDANNKNNENQNQQNSLTNNQKADKETLLKEIADLNGQLLNDTSMKVNRPMAYKLISKYELFVKTFTDDAQSPDFAFKAADLAQGLGDGKKAVQLYDFILDTYPSYDKYPEALFLKAFVQENILHELGAARDTYNKFMVDYPEHELYDDAEASVKYMGKSTEELIKEFEAKNKK